MSTAIIVKNLRKFYGRIRAVDGLSLTVPKGSVFGLVGPNGAGKTTTLGILGGAIRANSGSVNLLDQGPFDPIKHKGRITFLPQDIKIVGHTVVYDFLMYLSILQGLSKAQAKKSVDAMLDWVNLKDRASRPIRTLSHGMMRRLNIAQAFLGTPDIVLMDEPVSGLDPKQLVHIRYLMKSLKGKQTVVISSHILSEIEAVCDYVAFIDNGKTIREDTLNGIIRQNNRITYRLSSPGVSKEKIVASLPQCHLEERKNTLIIQFPDSMYHPQDVNKIVLNLLIEQNIGILEVVMGSRLEQEYMQQI